MRIYAWVSQRREIKCGECHERVLMGALPALELCWLSIATEIVARDAADCAALHPFCRHYSRTSWLSYTILTVDDLK